MRRLEALEKAVDFGAARGVADVAVAIRVGGLADRSEPLEIVAGGVIEVHRRAPFSQFGDSGRETNHRIIRGRARGMPGGSAGDQPDPARGFLGSRDGHVPHLAPYRHGRAALGQRVFGGDFVPVAVDQEVNADLRRAFLAGLGDEDHIAIQLHMTALEHQHDHEACGDDLFVVHGAAQLRR